MSEMAPVCPECQKGAMLPELYAEAAQSEDEARVAVVKNVPRRRCGVCSYPEIEPRVAVLVGGLLGGALQRNQVRVFDWEKQQASSDG